MATIAEQLTQLESDRQDLVDNLETQGITGLTGDETFTELVPEVLNIPAGANLSDYFYSTPITTGSSMSGLVKKIPPITLTSSITHLGYMFSPNYLLELPEIINFNYITSLNGAFGTSPYITTIPNYDTSNVTNFSSTFKNSPLLENVPVLDFGKVTYFYNTFENCPSLTDTSLNNILESCIGAVSYTGTKTLVQLGFSSTNYPASRIQALSNYQDFINAGWTIGY